MPNKQNQESQAEQSKRFKKTVADLVDAGELSPTDADRAIDTLVKNSKINQVVAKT